MAKKQEYKIVGPFQASGTQSRARRALQDALNKLGNKGWVLPVDQMVFRPYTTGTWQIASDGGAREFVARRPVN